MSIQTQTRQVGDTRIAIAGTLTRPDNTAVDLTSLTIKFKMVDSQGAVKVAETSSNITVTDATNGKVQYDPQDDDVDTPGTYNAYFIAESATGAQDTFPVETGEFRIIIQPVAR